MLLAEDFLSKNRNREEVYIYIDDFNSFKIIEYLHIMKNSDYLGVYSTVSISNISQITEYSRFWELSFFNNTPIKIIYPQLRIEDKNYFIDKGYDLKDIKNVLCDLGKSNIHICKNNKRCMAQFYVSYIFYYSPNIPSIIPNLLCFFL